RGHAGRRIVPRLAGHRGRRERDEEPRRQSAGAVAQEEPRRYDPRAAALRRSQQLRRRPVGAEAGPGRQVGRRVAEGARGAGPQTRAPLSIQAAALLGQAVVTGLLAGALYSLLALGLILSWGLLRLVNPGHFALAFLGAYLTFYPGTVFRLEPWLSALIIVPL